MAVAIRRGMDWTRHWKRWESMCISTTLDQPPTIHADYMEGVRIIEYLSQLSL